MYPNFFMTQLSNGNKSINLKNFCNKMKVLPQMDVKNGKTVYYKNLYAC